MLREKDKLFNRYEITQRIGRGRFATVWQAFDPKLDDIVAIKEINIDTGKENDAQDAIHEARLLRSLNSKHILTLWDVSIENDCVYLIMEYADGGTLRQMLDRQGPLPESQVMKLMAQLCEGLAFAHDRDVIHRDLKPENLFISGGTPKIGDFGLGRILRGSQRATSAGTGTLGYIAPEQYGRNHDKRVDIWAMGMVTLELLTGELPFDKDADPPQIMFQIMNPNQPIPIADSISPVTRDVLKKVLAKNPDARFQTAGELQTALEHLNTPTPDTLLENAQPERGGSRWSFADFCGVYCSPNKSSQELAEHLVRTEGAVDAVRALIDAVHKGKAKQGFPDKGKRWIDFVNRADNGECFCAQLSKDAQLERGGPGSRWSFADFCVVYCNPNKPSQELAERLNRTEGAIDAVRASIDAVHRGTATCRFPGKRWICWVNRADNGECFCCK